MPAGGEDRIIYLYRFRPSPLCVIISRYNQWPERNLRAKGFSSMYCFARRPMRPEDYEEDHPYRLKYWKYFSWQGLIDDERRLGTPEEFIQTLEEYALSHPLTGQSKKEETKFVEE